MQSRMAERRSAPPIPDVQDCLRPLIVDGVESLGVFTYMRKLAPARVSYRDDFFISYRVYIMTESFHISLFEGTLHGDKINVRFKIANIPHALPVPVYQQTDFTPKRVVLSRLHDAVARFRI